MTAATRHRGRRLRSSTARCCADVASGTVVMMVHIRDCNGGNEHRTFINGACGAVIAVAVASAAGNFASFIAGAAPNGTVTRRHTGGIAPR